MCPLLRLPPSCPLLPSSLNQNLALFYIPSKYIILVFIILKLYIGSSSRRKNTDFLRVWAFYRGVGSNTSPDKHPVPNFRSCLQPSFQIPQDLRCPRAACRHHHHEVLSLSSFLTLADFHCFIVSLFTHLKYVYFTLYSREFFKISNLLNFWK